MTKADRATNALTRAEVAALNAAVDKFGDFTRAARALSIPRGTFVQAVAGGALRKGSVEMIRGRLATEKAS